MYSLQTIVINNYLLLFIQYNYLLTYNYTFLRMLSTIDKNIYLVTSYDIHYYIAHFSDDKNISCIVPTYEVMNNCYFFMTRER